MAADNKWTTHNILLTVKTLGCPSTKDVIDAIRSQLDVDLPSLDATQVGKMQLKDLKRVGTLLPKSFRFARLHDTVLGSYTGPLTKTTRLPPNPRRR